MRGIQKHLEERTTKYDDLVNKPVMLEKESVTLKKTSESRRYVDKESIAYLKKEEGLQQNEAKG